MIKDCISYMQPTQSDTNSATPLHLLATNTIYFFALPMQSKCQIDDVLKGDEIFQSIISVGL